MSNILLLGGGLQTLSLARGLRRFGNAVYNIADNRSVGKYSRYVDLFVGCSINELTDIFIVKFAKEHDINVIIPTEDEYAEWLSENKDSIQAGCSVRCAVMSVDIFKRVINKSLLMKECRLAGVPHPLTIPLMVNSLDEAAKAVGFPALIKPDVSNGSRGICRVESIDRLKAKAPTILEEYGPCSLQEYIGNKHHYYNAMLYRYADGTWGYAVVTKITRFYPIKGGSSSFCTTMENPRIVEICQKLLTHLGWIGFADFDILEKEDGDYRVIEINPRVPASLHAALASGIDFGQMIVDDMTCSPRRHMSYLPGEQLRFLGLDIAWFVSSPDRFRTSPSWFKFWGAHLHYQEGGIKDYRAMAYSLWNGIRKQLSPSFRKAKSGMN